MQKILDSHCHIYPDCIAARATENIGRFYNIPMDCDGTLERLVYEGKRAGVTHYLVHSVSTRPEQVRNINDFIAGTVSSRCDMTGFGTLHPESCDIDRDIEHLIEIGLQGVKLHPDFQRFAIDSEGSIAMCKKIEGRLPLLIHAGDKRYDYSNPDRILRFLDKLPDITLIASHLGGWSVWDDAVRTLAGLPNVYFDTSSSFFALSPERAKEIILTYGTDKVMFGSDYPMWKASDELLKLHRLGLKPEEEQDVLYNTGARLLKLE